MNNGTAHDGSRHTLRSYEPRLSCLVLRLLTTQSLPLSSMPPRKKVALTMLVCGSVMTSLVRVDVV